MDRICLCIIFSCVVFRSTQQNIRITQKANTPLSEGDELSLRCIAESGYNLFRWSLNEEMVAQSTRTNSSLAPDRSTNRYVVSLNTNQQGKYVFRLEVDPVSRNDTGRWECEVSSTSGRPAQAARTTSVNVNYFPDPEYPTCNITASLRAVCTTQEGRPLVAMKWLEPTQATFVEIPSRDSRVSHGDGILHSEIEPSVLSPPESDTDYVACRIEQRSENRQCTILKKDIYVQASLNISQYGETTVSCSVEPPYFGNYLEFEWDHTELLHGNVSDYEDNTKEVKFWELTPNLNGTKILCKLVWGFFDVKNVSLNLVVNAPSTISPIPTVSTSEPSSSKPTVRSSVEETITQRSNDIDVRAKSTEPRSRGSITKATKSQSSDGVTPTIDLQTIISTDGTTETDYYEYDEFGSQMSIFIVALILVVLLLLCIICICVLCKRSKKGTATVI